MCALHRADQGFYLIPNSRYLYGATHSCCKSFVLTYGCSTIQVRSQTVEMENFLFVTHSRHKVAEAERVLGRRLMHHRLDLPELQSVDVEEVAIHKVKYAHEVLKRPVMVDDTGLYIDAWRGLPGALVKWFVQRVGDEGLCEMMQCFSVRSARAKTVVATYDGTLHTFVGTVEGVIAQVPTGWNGYSWETVFIPDTSDRTYAEMSRDEKERHSMRRKALEEMLRYYGR